MLICIWEPRDSTGVYHSHMDSDGSIAPGRTRCGELISRHHHRYSDRSSIPERESRGRRDLLAGFSISISEPLRQFPDLSLRVHLPFDRITPPAIFHTLWMSQNNLRLLTTHGHMTSVVTAATLHAVQSELQDEARQAARHPPPQNAPSVTYVAPESGRVFEPGARSGCGG